MKTVRCGSKPEIGTFRFLFSDQEWTFTLIILVVERFRKNINFTKLTNLKKYGHSAYQQFNQKNIFNFLKENKNPRRFMLIKGQWANRVTLSSDILDLKLFLSSHLFYIVILTVSKTFKWGMYHAADLIK